VYLPIELVKIIFGSHVPVIPLFETSGKLGGSLPRQILLLILNVGIIELVTTITNVVSFEHCPASGEKTYEDLPNVFVEIKAGVHLPVIPL
jgi:hypothetical protein